MDDNQALKIEHELNALTAEIEQEDSQPVLPKCTPKFPDKFLFSNERFLDRPKLSKSPFAIALMRSYSTGDGPSTFLSLDSNLPFNYSIRAFGLYPEITIWAPLEAKAWNVGKAFDIRDDYITKIQKDIGKISQIR